MTPKPPPLVVQRQDIIYEVVLENNKDQFRAKAQKLMERKFVPQGGISVTVNGGNIWVGQAFTRDPQYKDLE